MRIIIKTIIKKINSIIKTLIIPYRFCWGCEKIQIGTGLCSTCWGDLYFIGQNSCIFCNNNFQFGHIGCIDCGYKSMAVAHYKGIMCKIILQLKYGRRFYLGDFLINLISGMAYNKEYCILYIPHYKLKQIKISVNSSLLLAHCFQKKFGGKIIHNILYKTSKQRQKDSKNYKERWENGLFNYAIQNGHLLQNKSVVLIDDVMTTGSTLNTCARLISRHSPMNLFIITICKV